MLKIFKHLIILWSFIFTQLAFSYENSSGTSLEFIVKTINQNTTSKQSLLKFVKKNSIKKYEELNSFMQSEKISDSFQFPVLKLNSNNYEFTLSGVTIIFEPISANETKVSYGEKSIKVNSSMSLITLKQNMMTLFSETQKTSLLNLFIGNAQAQTLLAEVMIAALVIAAIIAMAGWLGTMVFYSAKEKNKEKALDDKMAELNNSTSAICARLEGVQPGEILLEKVSDTYNMFSESYSKMCSLMKDVDSVRKAACLEALTVKKCLQKSINRLSQVDNTNRNENKKVYYDAVEDKYTVKNVSH